MKILSMISLAFIISCGAFAEDEDEELPANREVIRSICIGVIHGGVRFGTTLLIFVPVQMIFPAAVRDPHEGTLHCGAGFLRRMVVGAVQNGALFHFILRPVADSMISNLLNQLSSNTQRNQLIARHSANLLVSICHGAVHLLNPTPSIIQVFYASVIACFDGELCYRYGGIAVATSRITFKIIGFLLRRVFSANAKN